jgi:hypothetical protein
VQAARRVEVALDSRRDGDSEAVAPALDLAAVGLDPLGRGAEG